MAYTDRKISHFYNLSHLQLGLLYHSVDKQTSKTYSILTLAQFSGFFDRDSFEASWRYIIERHEALRACFIWKEVEEPVQVILQEVALPIDWHDWRHLSKSEQDKRFFELVDEDRSRGLDPASAPLLRLTLVQMDDEEYRVILTMHHLIVDGWSLPIVFREFIECYRAFSSGQEPRLEPVRPYEDYITWLNQQDQQASEAYWRSALSGLLEPTRLGVGNSAKPTDQSVRQVIHSHRLTRTLTQALQDFARRNRVTLNTVFQAAWALLLSRHSETNDIVFGATTSGRPPELRGVEDIVGMFINTLPVRVRINPDCALVDWLHQLQIEQTERLEHQYSPLVDIHNWSDIPQSSPLFEVLYVFENFPTGSKTKNTTTKLEKTVSIENIHSISHSNYPLCLRVTPQRKALLDILFDPKYIPSSVAERLVVHLERLLAAMASADPEQKISTLSLLDEAERHQVLEEWNATAADYPQDRCLHELIAEQVARQPDAVAVEFEGQCLSYGELEARANQLAHHLRTLGVGPEVIVGLCVDRSAEMVVSLLAILKAGGAYLPLDPAYPPDRLAFMLQDAGASLVVCDDAHSGLVSDHPLVCLQADAEIIRQYPQSSPDVTVDAENLAYVIYTSGSTGRPKGVMIRHSSACNLVTALIDAFAITADSRVLQFASLSFDASVWEIFCTIKAGARLIVPPPRTHLVGSALADQITEKSVTNILLPPSILVTLETKPTNGLKNIVVAGEASLPSLLKPWCDGRRLVNGYGPTEATVISSWYLVNATEQTSVPIGHPIWNTQLYVLDGGLEPVPVGVSGELYIGGVGLARGYLGRPDLTAERFVPDPFGSAGGRLYRTGDRVCRRADGALEFLGRYDHQVKLRGYRIETGEIEAALTSHPSVGQAAVLLRADGPGEGRLVAYVVGDASAGDLRAHLQQTLPDYMVPAAFVTLSALPLTPNGKLDRKALPEPDDSGLVRKAYIAPRTPVEEMLTSIWAEVLGVTQVGVEDNFFDLGGHSLLAMQVMARVGQAFAVEIPLKVLFEAPCVKDLAVAVLKTDKKNTTELRKNDIKYLFFTPPTANNFCYESMIDNLSPKSTLVVNCKKIEKHVTSIDEAVNFYISNMPKTNLKKISAVAGWSAGGVFALAAAQKLKAITGKRVTTFMIDTHTCESLPVENRNKEAFWKLFVTQVGFSGSDGRQVVSKSFMSMNENDRLLKLAELAVPTSVDHKNILHELSKQLIEFRNWLPLISSHKFDNKIDTDLIYILASETKTNQYRASRWANVISGSTTIVSVPETHFSIIEKAGSQRIAEIVNFYSHSIV